MAGDDPAQGYWMVLEGLKLTLLQDFCPSQSSFLQNYQTPMSELIFGLWSNVPHILQQLGQLDKDHRKPLLLRANIIHNVNPGLINPPPLPPYRSTRSTRSDHTSKKGEPLWIINKPLWEMKGERWIIAWGWWEWWVSQQPLLYIEWGFHRMRVWMEWGFYRMMVS